jgi:hypothetical protein
MGSIWNAGPCDGGGSTSGKHRGICHRARDGSGRNGTFTSELLKNLKTPGLEVKDMFNRTCAGVRAVTSAAQTPAVYNQFFDNAYLAGSPGPSSAPAQTTTPTISVTRFYGSLVVTTATEGTLYLDGKAIDDIPPGASAKLDSVEVGSRGLELRYADGQLEQHTATVEAGSAASVAFTYRRAPPSVQAGGAAKEASSGAVASAYAQTDFFELVKTGTPQEIQAAISNGANVWARGKNGLTPLMAAADQNRNPEVIIVLLKAGANVNAQDEYGWTPLIHAVIDIQNPKVITTLLKAGANAKAKDKLGMTAFDYAKNNSYLKGSDALKKLEEASQ